MINSSTSEKMYLPDWLIDATKTSSGIEIPYFLTQLNTMWPDLEDRLGINVKSEEGVLNGIAFWENPLRNSSPDIYWPTDNRFPSVCYEDDPKIISDTVLPITKGMMAAKRIRSDLDHFDLSSFKGRLEFIYWRLTLGFKEYRYMRLRPQEIEYLGTPLIRFGEKLKHLPKAAELLPIFFMGDEEISQALESRDVETFEECWKGKRNEIQSIIESAKSYSGEKRLSISASKVESGGVNIIGLPSGQFGIGEDARTATRALLKIGIVPAVCEPPIAIGIAKVEKEWLHDLIVEEPKYKINIITIPAADTLRLFFLQWSNVLQKRYNICAWQWELPKWPDRWERLLNIPDEIWAQSHYVEEMFKKVTKKPVTYMPLAVDKPIFKPKSREYFDIEDNVYTFLSVFDCNSWFKRKNPMCAVKAFQKAFPKNQRGIRLVVKMMNSRPDLEEYRELMRTAALDLRIVVIDEYLTRSDMLALINCADVFVSLHRSEGFGRVIAECMLMGKPVISTNYSGSVDFAFEGTAYVVNGPLIPVQKGDYSVYEGQHWMDPDVEMAAQAMKRCVEDPKETTRIAKCGQAYIEKNHSIEAISERYRQRLAQLGVVD